MGRSTIDSRRQLRIPEPPKKNAIDPKRKGDIPYASDPKPIKNPVMIDEDSNDGTFLHPQARIIFTERSKHKPIAERQLIIDPENFDHITDNIVRRGWDVFTEQPLAINLSLVGEFYANAYVSPTRGVTIVRGVPVQFNSNTINQYYGIPEVSTREFTKLRKDIRYQDLIERLCPEGSNWSEMNKTFQRWELSREAKIWMYLISSRLMPTSNLSTPVAYRMVLAYAIMKGTPINVGVVIYNELLRCIHDKSSTMMFPSLLTGLCFEAELEAQQNDLLMRTPRAIKDFYKLADADPPEDEDDEDDEEAADSHAPSPPPPPRRKRKKAVPSIALPTTDSEDRKWKDAQESHMTWVKKVLKIMSRACGADISTVAEPMPYPPRPSTAKIGESSGVRHDEDENEDGEEDEQNE